MNNGRPTFGSASITVSIPSKPTLSELGGITPAEVDAKMRKLSCKDNTVLRMKGWGETNPEQLNELCLNPETRHLMQLQWTDDLPEVINKIMGAESNFRKELLGIN